MCILRTSVAGRLEADENLAKSDRLFRAAVSAFCALTNASRHDAVRLDQLAMPLLPLVSDDSRRLAAASLSQCFPGPHGLVRRLAEEDIGISAPILVASPVLTDIDLIGLIGRHGLGHAGAIARRRNLNPNIVALIRALGVGEAATPEPLIITVQEPAPVAEIARAEAVPTAEIEPVADAFEAVMTAEPGAAEYAAREALRAMMLPAGARAPSHAHPESAAQFDWSAARAAIPGIVETGLTGKAALFHTAIADAFDLDFATAIDVAEDIDTRRLAVALRAAEVSTAEAYLIAALAFPPRFATTASIRSFVGLYASLDLAQSRQEVISWRARDETPLSHEAANLDNPLISERKRLSA